MDRRPTPEERDERTKVDFDPEEFIGGVLAAGPHADEDETRKDREDDEWTKDAIARREGDTIPLADVLRELDEDSEDSTDDA